MDPFDLVFDILRKILQVSDQSSGLLENLEACTHDLALSSLQAIAQDSEEELRKLKLKRQNVENQFTRASAFFESSAQEISSRRDTVLFQMQSHQAAVKQRLHIQRTTAERRLEELCLEMVGEYAKCLLRGKRREKTLSMKDTEDRVVQTSLLTWRRFALRLQYDLSHPPSLTSTTPTNSHKLQVLVLDPTSDVVQVEVNRLISKGIKKKIGLFTEEDLNVHAVLRITPVRPLVKANNNTNLLCSFAASHHELEQLLDTIKDWGMRNSHAAITSPSKSASVNAATPARSRSGSRHMHAHTHTTTSNHNNTSRSIKSSDLVHTTCLEYIHPPSQVSHPVWQDVLQHTRRHASPSFLDVYVSRYGASLSSSMVYVCLEERVWRKKVYGAHACMTKGAGGGDGAEVLDLLEQVYVQEDASFLTQSESHAHSSPHHRLLQVLQGGLLQVEGRVQGGHHRTMRSSPLQLFPDVVMARPTRGNVDDSIGGDILHFVPASVCCLLERDKWLKSAGMDDGVEVPFFVLAQPPAPLSEVSSSSSLLLQQLEKGLAVEIGVANSTMASHGASVEAGKDGQFSTSMPTVVLPLSPLGVSLLNQHYGVDDSSTNNTSTSGWSSLSLLPDHPYPYTYVYAQPTPKPPLYCKYMLVETHTSMQTHATDPAPSSSSSGLPCLYLIQLHPHSNMHPSQNQGATTLTTILSRQYKEGEIVQPKPNPISHNNQNERDKDKDKKSHAHANTTLTAHSWDLQVLSPLCFWRACLSSHLPIQPNSHPTTLPLCVPHQALQRFLDEKVGFNSKDKGESAKYLPRQPPLFSSPLPVQHKRDIITMRGASPLLQELWEGKLKTTLKIFHKKNMKDIQLKTYLQTKMNMKNVSAYIEQVMRTNSSFIPATPSWLVWKEENLKDTVKNRQIASVKILQDILVLEREAGRELEGLREYGIFPSAEVGVIRKDIKSLRERQNEILEGEGEDAVGMIREKSMDMLGDNNYTALLSLLEEELAISVKKRELLMRRRETEEVERERLNRRLLRQKHTEEMQEKDPSSFKHQGRFQ